MSKKEKADAMKRLKNLNAFMAKRSKAPAAPKRKVVGRRSLPPADEAYRAAAFNPIVVRRRAGSVPAAFKPRRAVSPKSPLSAFGPVVRPQGWVQPVQVQVQPVQVQVPPRTLEQERADRLRKQEQQYEAMKAAKAAANRQRKQEQHAELRSRAYKSASADVKKNLDFLAAHGDLSTFNKLMDKLAQQQEQRQGAQRVAKAKQQQQGLKAHGAFKWGVMSAAKAREERAAAKAKAQTQATQAAKAKAQADRLSSVPLPGQSAQAFKLRMSQNALLARKAAVKVREQAAAAKRKAQTERMIGKLDEEMRGLPHAPLIPPPRPHGLPTYEQAVRAPVRPLVQGSLIQL
jgi:hypothetical protein